MSCTQTQRRYSSFQYEHSFSQLKEKQMGLNLLPPQDLTIRYYY
uniref:Uncharacterized protein n=1 Tax=Anguilla anguilla TaxID=7936 RepID=A0A0E9QD50_ANGAN